MQMRRSLVTATTKAATALAAAAAVALAAVLMALAAMPAHADVGVEKVNRHGGAPGTSVTLTLGCGFCFPPCVGPKGQRHPKGFDHGPCMLGTKKDPPAWFGVSVVPRSRAPQLLECGPNALCPPSTLAPPRRAPFTYLGRAIPPPGGNDPESGDPPRYLLDFTIPDLRPGAYAYEIWCGVCAAGREGSLISAPDSRLWRLSVREAQGIGRRARALKPVGVDGRRCSISSSSWMRRSTSRPRMGWPTPT